MIAKRVEVLSESLTIAITTLAKDMRDNGEDVLSFSAGEPDFGTPEVIRNAAIAAIREGNSSYTAIPGTLEVLQAVKTKLKRDNGLDYEVSDIVTSNGAKHSLFNLFQVLLNIGDEVIIPAPYWVTYPEIVKYSEGIPVFIDTDDVSEFKISPKQLKNAITDKTKF